MTYLTALCDDETVELNKTEKYWALMNRNAAEWNL